MAVSYQASYVELFGTGLRGYRGGISSPPPGAANYERPDIIGGEQMNNTLSGAGSWTGIAGVICMTNADQQTYGAFLDSSHTPDDDESHPAGFLPHANTNTVAGLHALRRLAGSGTGLHREVVTYTWGNCCSQFDPTVVVENIP